MGIQVVDDNTKLLRPHKGPQEIFCALPDSIFECLYGGAAGPGKSWALLSIPILRELYKDPNFKGAIFRRTFPELEESLIPESEKIYPLVGGRYNAQRHMWKFESGAYIKFGYSKEEKDVHQHDTAEYNYLAIDELTHFTEYQYRYLTHRVRAKRHTGLPAIVRTASNPGNIGHTWVRSRFISPHRAGFKRLYDTYTETERMYIPARLEDNPTVDEQYIRRLRILPEAERKAKMEGDWWTFAGQVFEEFRNLKFDDEPSNALHVVAPFEIPEWWPKLVICDWGYTAMTYVLVVAISPDARVYAYKEYSVKKKKIKEWGADVAAMLQFEYNIKKCILDGSAFGDRGEDKTLAQQIEDATGFQWDRADKDRIGGKMALHDLLRWKPRPPKYVPPGGYDDEYANRLLRINGLEAYKGYQDLFLPEAPETNIPRLQIFAAPEKENYRPKIREYGCPVLIDAIPTAVYDEKDPEDIKEYDGDDPIDTARYMAKAVDKYTDEVAKEAKTRHTEAQIVEQLQSDLTSQEAWTSYYRRMEKLEATRDEDGPVPVFHYGADSRLH